MRRSVLTTVFVSLVLCSPLASAVAATQNPQPVQPQQQSDQAALRAEMDRLRAQLDTLTRQYKEQLSALEARLAALEAARPATPAPTAPPAAAPPAGAQPAPPPPEAQAAPPPAAQPVAPAVSVPEGASGAGGPEGSLPNYANASAMSKIFNPDMAVIGNFLGAAGRNPVAPGPSLDMHEAELSMQAIVDPYARADFFLSAGPDGTLNTEEGFITFTTLPGGILAKVGKLRSAFGKVNQMHTHVLPWTDRPLVTNNLLGGEDGISDAGISVSRLLPNPWLFLEATGEVYRGENAVFRAPSRSDLTYVGHLRAFRDISDSTNIDLGSSIAFGHNDAGPNDTTRLVGIDATFRYRPLRRAIYRRFLARTELVWSHRSEMPNGPQAFGAYLSGEYQFARRWFGGVRLDYSDRATMPSLTDKGASALVTYWPSEFSQIRGQYRRTRYAEGQTSNEFLFQFLFSIGAHGAHAF